MSWPILAATAVGLVVGINLGVLLMVALQAGRKQDDAYGEARLRARIRELESALAGPPRPHALPDQAEPDLIPAGNGSTEAGGRTSSATG